MTIQPHSTWILLLSSWLLVTMLQANTSAKDRRLSAPVKLGIDNECPLPLLPNNKRMKQLVRRLGSGDGLSVWGHCAVAYDLNGDSKPEYVVMLDCSAVGNCNWAVFATHPTRLLGTIYGKDLYFRQRVGQWAAITTYGHLSASWGALTTFCFRKQGYTQCTKQHEVSVEQGNIPRFVQQRPANCPR